MKRLLDLHSKFRADKAELKICKKDVGIQAKIARLRLKMEREGALRQIGRDHELRLLRIRDDLARNLQTIHIEERNKETTQERFRALELLQQSSYEEARRKSKIENEKHAKEEEEILNNYLKELESLEDKYVKEISKIETLRIETISKFEDDQKKLIDIYRREKAERGGEA